MLIIFRAVVVLVAVSFLSACSSGGDTPPPPAPAVSVTLTVATAGTGVGLVTSNPAGLNCGTTCTLTVTSGTIVTLTASPAAGNTLASWGGACATAAATCDVTVSANQTVTATFNPSTANPALTVTPSGTGGGAITCNGGACNPTYPWGTSVTLAAVPNGNSSFAGWSGGGCAGTAPCTVLLWDNTAITATFNTLPVTAQLSVTRLGTGAGTVTSNPAGITCGATCASNFPGGTVVTLTASAAVGSTFAGWSGGGCTGTGTCDVTLNANAAVTATFTTIPPTVTLTTTAAGTGTGTITCNGGVCQSSYPSGTALTIVATPAATSLFAGWGGACAASGTTTTCNVTMNTNSTVSAMFNLPTLSIVVAGTGTVTSSPAGINCGSTCTASFSKNTTVTLTVTGANFSGWSGGGCSGSGTCAVTLTQNTTVTATFGVASSGDRYLFFGNFSGPTGVTGSLMAVDPAAPGATPIAVSASVSNSVPLYSSSWNSVAKTFGNVLLEQQVYSSGGKLWRVQAAKASGAPGSALNPAVQISSEANATHVCTLAIVDDASSPAARRIFYELPGADGQCGIVSGLGGTKADNVTKYVSAGDGVGTAPISLPIGHNLLLDRSNIYDLNTGLATHIFVIDAANSNTLKLFNLTTQSLTSIQANIPDANVVVQDTSDRVLLSSSGTNTLYVYTISTNQLVPLLTAGILSVSETLSDGANLFVSDSSAGIVYRVPLNATASGQVVPILNGGWAFAVSTNRVYAVNNNATSVLSVAKTGGAVRVDEPIVAGQNIAPSLGSANGLVYYTKYVSTFTPPPGAITSATTVALAENGVQVLTLANTTWAGSWFGPTFSPRGSSLVSRVFVTSIAGGQLNGGTMSSFDAATGTLGQTLGTVPTTTPGIVPSPGAVFVTDVLGSSALAFGVLQDPTGFSSAVFFVDPAVPNSLVQVPVSPGPWLSAF